MNFKSDNVLGRSACDAAGTRAHFVVGWSEWFACAKKGANK